MDFVAWCTSIINKLIAVSLAERDAWYAGVSIDALARSFFGRDLSMLAGTNEGRAIVDATWEMQKIGLVGRKDKDGKWLEVTRDGQEFAEDMTVLLGTNLLEEPQARGSRTSTSY